MVCYKEIMQISFTNYLWPGVDLRFPKERCGGSTPHCRGSCPPMLQAFSPHWCWCQPPWTVKSLKQVKTSLPFPMVLRDMSSPPLLLKLQSCLCPSQQGCAEAGFIWDQAAVKRFPLFKSPPWDQAGRETFPTVLLLLFHP